MGDMSLCFRRRKKEGKDGEKKEDRESPVDAEPTQVTFYEASNTKLPTSPP